MPWVICSDKSPSYCSDRAEEGLPFVLGLPVNWCGIVRRRHIRRLGFKLRQYVQLDAYMLAMFVDSQRLHWTNVLLFSVTLQTQFYFASHIHVIIIQVSSLIERLNQITTCVRVLSFALALHRAIWGHGLPDMILFSIVEGYTKVSIIYAFLVWNCFK